jgi:hypothetical protein
VISPASGSMFSNFPSVFDSWNRSPNIATGV